MSMSESMKLKINWAVTVTVLIQAVWVIVFLTRLDSKASDGLQQIKAIRSDFGVIQNKVQDLDVRTARLEEHTLTTK